MFIRLRSLTILYISFMIVIALITGCTKSFDQINTNPVVFNKDNFNPSYLLTAAQRSYTGSPGTRGGGEVISSNFIYLSGVTQGMSSVLNYWAGDKYLLNEQYTGSYWGGAYSNQVKPIVDLIQLVKDKPELNNLYQIARIMKALIMERITDCYGDIPYFNAGLGFYDNIFFPEYDKQEDIYSDLLMEVEDATNSLDESGDILTGDVYYNGDINKWKKFGNTLLLRIAMRLTKVNPNTAKEYVGKVLGKTMQSNDDNAFLVGEEAGGGATENKNSQVLLGRGGQDYYYAKWSKTLIDLLRNNHDPRLGKIAVTQLYLSSSSTTQNPNFLTDPAVQKGMPNGKDQTDRPGLGISTDPSFTTMPDYSSVTPFMTSLGGPTFILTYAESELLLADASQRWGIGGDPSDHYNHGVEAALTYLSQYDPVLVISGDDVASYLTEHPYETGVGLDMINTQYWILTCTMLDFYEAWANWRRADLPLLTPVVYPGNATNGQIPRRFPYPLSEASSNPVNFKIASDAVPGGDNLMGRVWWDIQ